ncbi:hypothetical protein [Streptomyces galbus]|uniref:hypothetical protein n=1 Tax=Streptomyces galbus TaxID=33898 RepID=UPI003EB89F7F
MALPLLAWLTEVSADASLSVLGFDAFGAGIELRGRLGMALVCGALWGAGAGAAGGWLAWVCGAAGCGRCPWRRGRVGCGGRRPSPGCGRGSLRAGCAVPAAEPGDESVPAASGGGAGTTGPRAGAGGCRATARRGHVGCADGRGAPRAAAGEEEPGPVGRRSATAAPSPAGGPAEAAEGAEGVAGGEGRCPVGRTTSVVLWPPPRRPLLRVRQADLGGGGHRVPDTVVTP